MKRCWNITCFSGYAAGSYFTAIPEHKADLGKIRHFRDWVVERID